MIKARLIARQRTELANAYSGCISFINIIIMIYSRRSDCFIHLSIIISYDDALEQQQT